METVTINGKIFQTKGEWISFQEPFDEWTINKLDKANLRNKAYRSKQKSQGLETPESDHAGKSISLLPNALTSNFAESTARE